MDLCLKKNLFQNLRENLELILVSTTHLDLIILNLNLSLLRTLGVLTKKDPIYISAGEFNLWNLSGSY